jgi:hypothetical protein
MCPDDVAEKTIQRGWVAAPAAALEATASMPTTDTNDSIRLMQ